MPKNKIGFSYLIINLVIFLIFGYFLVEILHYVINKILLDPNLWLTTIHQNSEIFNKIRNLALISVVLLSPIALYLASERLKQNEKTLGQTAQTVDTEMFHGALKLLNSDKEYSLQGAIRALQIYSDWTDDEERKRDTHRLLAGFIQARRYSLQPASEWPESDVDETENGIGEKKLRSRKSQTNVDVNTAVTVLRESYPKNKILTSTYDTRAFIFDLTQVDFPKYTDFRYSKLPPTNFADSIMPESIFLGADLSVSSFISCNLYKAEFVDAIFDARTDFTRANLCGAKFNDSNITSEMIEESYGDMETKLPEGVTRPEGWNEYRATLDDWRTWHKGVVEEESRAEAEST